MDTKDFEKKLENISENEADPRLRFDAFMGGVKDGGLRSVSSISLIVCYIIANVSEGVTFEAITSALTQGELANYFEVANAISKLKQQGTVIEGEDGVLTLNDESMANIDLIEQDLPYTVRENSIYLVQKTLAKEKHRREVKADITRKGDSYYVNLAIGNEGKEYLTLKIFAASETQACMIKEKFITDPAKVYETLIDTIFSNEE
ncbi:MAG: DUF4364 family protein [Eubacterium sp.]|nr:DUF4364 family protein [Eubacterium sp.]